MKLLFSGLALSAKANNRPNMPRLAEMRSLESMYTSEFEEEEQHQRRL